MLFNGFLLRPVQISWHQKGKPFWIMMKRE